MAEAPPVHTSNVPALRDPLRLAPTLVFGGLLGILLFAALLPRVSPPPRVSGLLGGDEVAEAARLLRGCLVIPTRDLRFASALTGDALCGVRPASDLDLRLDRAQALVEGAARMHPRDARATAALAAIDIARHRYVVAESRYRNALDRSPNFSEARLGLGVTLALHAEIEREPLLRRRMRLQAIGQFAAVTPQDPEFAAALFGRTLLLDQVGRGAEARELAERYLALDPSSHWADRIRTQIQPS